MKYLLITFLLFSFNSYACSNWITVSELAKSQAGKSAKPGCKGDEKCFCYEGIDLRDAKVGMKEVDDKTKPIYEDVIETEQVLKGYEQKEVDDESKPILNSDGEATGYEKKLVDDKEKPIYEEVSKVVGEEIVGYEKKEVEGLIVDEARKAERLEKENQIKAEREAKQKYKDRLQEAVEILADEIGRDSQGKFLPKEQIRQNAKALKNIMKAK